MTSVERSLMASSIRSKKLNKNVRVSRKSKLAHNNLDDSENFDAEADQMEEDLLDELSECNLNDSPERHMPQTGRLRVKLHG